MQLPQINTTHKAQYVQTTQYIQMSNITISQWSKTANLYFLIHSPVSILQLSHSQVFALDAPEELGGKEKRIADLVIIGTYAAIGSRVKHLFPNTTFTFTFPFLPQTLTPLKVKLT